MGNCAGKKAKDREYQNYPNRSYEEHSTTKHHLRLGVQLEKSPEGEVHVGFKGGLEDKKDVIVKIEEEEKKNNNSDSIENKIPKILDIIDDQQ